MNAQKNISGFLSLCDSILASQITLFKQQKVTFLFKRIA